MYKREIIKTVPRPQTCCTITKEEEESEFDLHCCGDLEEPFFKAGGDDEDDDDDDELDLDTEEEED